MTLAQESPDLPDLPETQANPTLPEPIAPDTASTNLPDNPQTNSRIPRMTQEQMDQLQKEKNWLTEGLKEKEMQAQALRDEEARTQKSIIDEILERNQQQVSTLNAQESGQLNTPKQNGGMKAALSTTAWEPLEPMQSSSFNATTGKADNTTQDYQKRHEVTGISNVFFNPATGGFESQPVDMNANLAMNRPELEKPWLQQNNSQQEVYEKNQVEAFEAQMMQQARAENKLPENYSNPSMTLNDPSSPLLASNTT